MLLEWAEIKFEVRVNDTDESYPAGMTPEETAVYIARNKAHAIRMEEDEIVIAADTIVVLGSEIIGKPRDRQHAMDILTSLSGRVHRVITGVVIKDSSQEKSFYDSTDVAFHELTADQVAFYIDNYKPYDKAGAYAIQEWIGVVGIKSINGDFYNVMGLPVSRLVKTLQHFV